MMQVSAEIRWFWRTKPPEGLEDWFRSAMLHGCEAGGGQPRHDEYLRDRGDLQLGIKRRNGKSGVEIKGFLGLADSSFDTGPFRGAIELWGKWESHVLGLDNLPLVTVEKGRWLRLFSTSTPLPAEIPLNEDEQPREPLAHPLTRYCTIEFTKVNLVEEDPWWTFGLEATGSLKTVEEDLRHVATLIAERWRLPCLDGLQASYPAWLKEHAVEALAHAS